MSLKFSIIIPARNAQRTIRKCLKSIRGMDYPSHNYEIIVIDDGSNDRTSEIAEEFGAKVTRQSCSSIAAVRNLGANQAKGEILAHLDSDMVVDPRWLAKAEEYFYPGFTGGLYFVDDVPENASWIGRLWYGPLREKKDEVREVDYLPTRNLFVNKNLHDLYGGFDESLFKGRKGGSDKEFTYRFYLAGRSLVSDPSLRMIHLGYEKTLIEFIRKEWWRQGNTLFLARKFKYPLRLLRNPLLSFFHLLCLVALAISLSVGSGSFLAIFFLLWILPSSLLLLKRMDIRRYWSNLPSLWLVTFIRWNVAGFSLIPQLMSLARKT